MASKRNSLADTASTGTSDNGLNNPPTNNSSMDIRDTGEQDESADLRAKFSTERPLIDGKQVDVNAQTSPLLSSTPPVVAKSLVRAYPYLLIVNKFLAIVTWTNEDYWINIILICLYAFIVLYFESLVTWFGHIILVIFITLYALLNNKIIEETKLRPTLDDVIQALTATSTKADLLLTPITSLGLTSNDIRRLLFTIVFLTPIYLIATFLIFKPRIILLVTGIYILTYHSSYSRVTRRLLWKLKITRLLFFYLTGLDFLQARNHSLFAAAIAKVQKNAGHSLNPLSSEGDNKPVRFTYVIYENQRKWLGIGWTSNLLSYERTPWTDEFLNESSSVETFKLPNTEYDSQKLNGATWRWVDKTWRLDLTNDGAITLPANKRSKTSANPSLDDGFIYYDNTWKKPGTEDTFSKYTRRRRWIRTAELVFDNSSKTVESEEGVVDTQPTAIAIDSAAPKIPPRIPKRRSLRFAEPEESTTEVTADQSANNLTAEPIKSDKVQVGNESASKLYNESKKKTD